FACSRGCYVCWCCRAFSDLVLRTTCIGVVVMTVPTIGYRVITFVQWPPRGVVRNRSVASEISVEFSGGYRQQLSVWAGSTWAGVNRVNHPQGLGFTVDGVNADPCGAEALGAQSVEFR